MKVTVILNNQPERSKVFEELAGEDTECTFVPNTAPEEELLAACKDADAIILGAPGANIKRDILSQCPNVKLVQSIMAGYDSMDVPGFASLGVPFANNGGSNATPVAEHSLGLVLALGRGIRRIADNARERKWSDGMRAHPTWELSGKRVGLVGLGPIGQRMAHLLRGFDCDVVYYKRTPASPELERELNVRFVPLDELMSTSDVVSIYLALTDSSRGLIGRREIGLMKPTAMIINTSRGGVIDEQALIEALQEGRIAAAGLDVLEQEPTPDENPLLDMANVIVTPHMSGGSRESGPRSAKFAMENVARAARGEPILSVINP